MSSSHTVYKEKALENRATDKDPQKKQQNDNLANVEIKGCFCCENPNH